MPKLKIFVGFLMAVVLVAAVVIAVPSRAQPSSGVWGGETKIDPMIDFEGVSFTQVFPIYTNLCGMKKIKVDADESVKKCMASIAFKTSRPITLTETIQLFENAFQKQAGIEITHPSTNQVVLRMQKRNQKFCTP